MCHPYLVHGWSLVQSSQLAGAGVLMSLLLIKLHDCSFWTVQLVTVVQVGYPHGSVGQLQRRIPTLAVEG